MLVSLRPYKRVVLLVSALSLTFPEIGPTCRKTPSTAYDVAVDATGPTIAAATFCQTRIRF